MDNQHRRIRGYRELTEEEIALMNKVKDLGPQIQEVIEEVVAYLTQQSSLTPMLSQPLRGEDGEITPENAARLRLNAAEPGRWAAISKTHFQEGLMALTRAVAQPGFF